MLDQSPFKDFLDFRERFDHFRNGFISRSGRTKIFIALHSRIIQRGFEPLVLIELGPPLTIGFGGRLSPAFLPAIIVLIFISHLFFFLLLSPVERVRLEMGVPILSFANR